MAIEHRESENLLRDGTVYQPRLLVCGDCFGRKGAELFFGFRPGGGWSLYVDEDPVLQFTESGQLRRLYSDRRKYLADAGRLVELRRERAGGRVRMERAALSAEKQMELLTDGAALLSEVSIAIQDGRLQVAGFIPEHGDAPVGLAQEALQRAMHRGMAGQLAVAMQAGANQ